MSNSDGSKMSIMRTIFLAAALFLAAGCGTVISENVMKTVDRDIAFKSVVADPAKYEGKSVVFGGTIIKVENFENRTVMEVVEEGMNSQLKPVDKDASAGRFLARFDRFMDPAIFAPGKKITVAGVVSGTETRPLGKGNYRYPVISPTEHYLWEQDEFDRGGWPRIGIGIGFGYTHID